MSSLEKSAHLYFNQDSDTDLEDSFSLTVIEDENLDGASWKKARTRFDEIVWSELQNTPIDKWHADALSGLSGVEMVEQRSHAHP